MKLAGRKMVASTSTSGSAGRERRERGLDAARHLERVAPGLLLDDQQEARPIVTSAVADRRGGESSTHVGDVAERHGRAPGRRERRGGELARGVATSGGWTTARRCVRRVDEAARARQRRASRVALSTASRPTPLRARAARDRPRTWSWRSRSPQIATLATPGTAMQARAHDPAREVGQLHLRQRLRRTCRS